MPSFQDLILRTERLILRPLTLDDAPALFEIFSDPRVARYGSAPPWTSLDKAVKTIERDVAAMADGSALRLALVGIEDGALLGTCTLFGFHEDSRRAEVGYGLHPSAWGCGYAVEAVTALLAHGFDVLALNRVEADIDPANVASARLLERLGFVREGLLRERWIVDGAVSDSAMYGLLAREWSATRG